MSENSRERSSGKGARLLTVLLASIIVLAGITAGHASGGWPPPGVFLAVAILLFFLFGAIHLLEDPARRVQPAKVRKD